MAYLDFLSNINGKFNALLNEISAIHNFEYGDEFELALCKALRAILPSKYGICRGYVVSKDGAHAGDDIIIYDQDRFPTLRLLADDKFPSKQQIPIEAVYAYIEAKHTLYLEGTGGQSLTKAINQIQSVKKIHREKVSLSYITPQVVISTLVNSTPNWPDYRNPLYTAIISRNIKLKESAEIPGLDYCKHLGLYCTILSQNNTAPDLIIAGNNILAIPAVNSQIESPFFIENISQLSAIQTENKAFGAGITNMLYAFDYIMLGNIHWPSVISEELGLKLNI